MTITTTKQHIEATAKRIEAGFYIEIFTHGNSCYAHETMHRTLDDVAKGDDFGIHPVTVLYIEPGVKVVDVTAQAVEKWFEIVEPAIDYWDAESAPTYPAWIEDAFPRLCDDSRSDYMNSNNLGYVHQGDESFVVSVRT